MNYLRYLIIEFWPKTGMPGPFGPKTGTWYSLKPSKKHTPGALRLTSLTWFPVFWREMGPVHLNFVYLV